MEDVTQEMRNAAAGAFLEDEETPEPVTYDECLYDAAGGMEWLILTDEEADARTTDYIRESLWAFNASFLVHFVPEGVDEDVLSMISEKYESGNAAMLGLVGDRFEDLVSDAISADGRGHFLAGYDSNEDEFEHDGMTWYAYRTN